MLSVKANNVISKLPKQLLLHPAEVDFFLQNAFGELAVLKCIVIKPKC